MSFQVTLTTPDRTYYDGQANGVTAPGLNGYFGVLSRHAPMISAIGMGILSVHGTDGDRWFVLDAGVAEVGGDRLTLFADEVRDAASLAEAEEKLQEWQVARESVTLAQ